MAPQECFYMFEMYPYSTQDTATSLGYRFMHGEGGLKCPQEVYRALQMARNYIIGYKILKRELERDAEELRKVGLADYALKRQEAANRLLADIRYWEDEVAKLESECFGV
ncbi:MAG: hypothetical protein AOA65_1380 [Candidatus Bathyarchaeota archaeon BA1]|nr:MAG: hypothetical protein AOA65_1380 [Candidatus Bathyarchaeota archaeon BA1]